VTNQLCALCGKNSKTGKGKIKERINRKERNGEQRTQRIDTDSSIRVCPDLFFQHVEDCGEERKNKNQSWYFA
jgi:hypothetical protein